jgi:hypothetical protein
MFSTLWVKIKTRLGFGERGQKGEKATPVPSVPPNSHLTPESPVLPEPPVSPTVISEEIPLGVCGDFVELVIIPALVRGYEEDVSIQDIVNRATHTGNVLSDFVNVFECSVEQYSAIVQRLYNDIWMSAFHGSDYVVDFGGKTEDLKKLWVYRKSNLRAISHLHTMASYGAVLSATENALHSRIVMWDDNSNLHDVIRRGLYDFGLSGLSEEERNEINSDVQIRRKVVREIETKLEKYEVIKAYKYFINEVLFKAALPKKIRRKLQDFNERLEKCFDTPSENLPTDGRTVNNILGQDFRKILEESLCEKFQGKLYKHAIIKGKSSEAASFTKMFLAFSRKCLIKYCGNDKCKFIPEIQNSLDKADYMEQASANLPSSKENNNALRWSRAKHDYHTADRDYICSSGEIPLDDECTDGGDAFWTYKPRGGFNTSDFNKCKLHSDGTVVKECCPKGTFVTTSMPNRSNPPPKWESYEEAELWLKEFRENKVEDDYHLPAGSVIIKGIAYLQVGKSSDYPEGVEIVEGIPYNNDESLIHGRTKLPFPNRTLIGKNGEYLVAIIDKELEGLSDLSYAVVNSDGSASKTICNALPILKGEKLGVCKSLETISCVYEYEALKATSSKGIEYKLCRFEIDGENLNCYCTAGDNGKIAVLLNDGVSWKWCDTDIGRTEEEINDIFEGKFDVVSTGVYLPSKNHTVTFNDDGSVTELIATTDEKIPRDKHGNKLGGEHDLVEDDYFNGEKILIINLCGFDIEKTTDTLRRKGFFPLPVIKSIPEKSKFTELLRKCNQFWLISNASDRFSNEAIMEIKNFFDEGKGIFLWSDNHPLYKTTNDIINELFQTEMSGEFKADKILTSIQDDDSGLNGIVSTHPVGTNIENIYEGYTVSEVKMTEELSPVLIGSDDIVISAAYDKDGKKAILDGGFTRLSSNFDSAGTARYIANAAAWLGMRDTTSQT